MFPELGQSLSSNELFLSFFATFDGTSLWVGIINVQTSYVLHDACSSVLADLLLRTSTSFGITLFNQRTSIILSTQTDLSTVCTILAIEDICAVKLYLGWVNILDHVLLDLRVIVQHGKAMCHIACQVLFFLFVCVYGALNWVNFSLNIIKGPLLGLLHLNHHLLDLLELLEAVGLHLFKLFLFVDEHLKTWVIMLPKESMLHYSSPILFNHRETSVCVLNPVLVKIFNFLTVCLNLFILRWVLHLLSLRVSHVVCWIALSVGCCLFSVGKWCFLTLNCSIFGVGVGLFH